MVMRVENQIIYRYVLSIMTFVIGTLITPKTTPLEPVRTIQEVPVFKLNFYFMGTTDVKKELGLSMGRNVEILNEEFEGKIKFELNNIFADSNGAYLPVIYRDVMKGEVTDLQKLINPIEMQGAINIYVFDTYMEEGKDIALMGFTPILRMHHHHYELESPEFDRIYMAYSGLLGESTLVHEMGHFLNLKHPWEMSRLASNHLGLHNKEEVAKNHMAYGPHVERFTLEQLESMRVFSLRHRSYLLDRIETSIIQYAIN